jgi:hypothetical protein
MWVKEVFMEKISVVYKDFSIVKVEEELSDLYVRELKKYGYKDILKENWLFDFDDGISSRQIVIRDRKGDAVVADGVVKEISGETGICRVVVELYSLPREGNDERQRFLENVKWYFANRDDVIEINGEEKPQRYSLTICVWHKDTAKDLLKFYVKALKYHYPNATVKNYYPLVTKQDIKDSLENRFDDNRWTGEIWLLIKRKKRNTVKISEYTWYKKERMLVLSLSCLPFGKQKEFIRKAKQMLKDKKAKIQIL